jgi:predicted Abi (CAAX) family protease
MFAGACAIATGFVDPIHDMSQPTRSPWKVMGAFVVPSLMEELVWRAALLPHPSGQPVTVKHAILILCLHVLMHPVIGQSGLWPRGQDTFTDPRFLLLATIVLGGATASYVVTGGSVYAAAFAHGVPLILWRDFFGGERRLTEDGKNE